MTVPAARSGFLLFPAGGAAPGIARNARFQLGRLGKGVALFIPALLLLTCCLHAWATGNPTFVLALGTVFQVVVATFNLGKCRAYQPSVLPSLFLLYLVATGWLCLALPAGDWFLRFGLASLLLAALAVLAREFLEASGVVEMRRARLLGERIARRADWPADAEQWRTLPEVVAFRDAVYFDAAPALALLDQPSAEVRIAALTALAFRKDWRPGQPEFILRMARRVRETGVRIAAIHALANVGEREVIEWLAEVLNDRSRPVRQAAQEALLRDTRAHWSWMRLAVRHYLANSALQEDGALVPRGQSLAPEAIKDLTAWTAEKGVLGIRAATTLAVHYARALTEQPANVLVPELRRQLADVHTAPTLRMQLAQLLQENDLLDRPVQEKLLDPLNPAPLRLIAAEALLRGGEHHGAITALRDLARLPNREMGLATAEVIQRRLGVDLGLALGEPLPALHTRQAAEVTRRVMMWASDKDLMDVVETPDR